jgi:hypothetical protein
MVQEEYKAKKQQTSRALEQLSSSDFCIGRRRVGGEEEAARGCHHLHIGSVYLSPMSGVCKRKESRKRRSRVRLPACPSDMNLSASYKRRL